MFTKLAKLLSPTLRKKEGFTLIELLIVVAIIAILAAIAIPQFSAYRKRGYNASANSDSRNLRTTQEAMYADFQEYGISLTAADTAGGHNGTGTVVATSSSLLLVLCGQNSATTCQSSINLSPNVSAVSHSYADTTATVNKNLRYALATKHLAGDVIYGVGSYETSPYRKSGTENTVLVTGDLTTPTGPTTAVFSSPWITLQ